jgi:hypothetical protein
LAVRPNLGASIVTGIAGLEVAMTLTGVRDVREVSRAVIA